LLTKEIVREFLDYDTETGILTWRYRDRKWFKTDRSCKIWNTQFSGKEAFTALSSDGYFCGRILDKRYQAHRIIWLLMTGKWPEEVDHINHDKKDNRQLNLREVSHQENGKNQSKQKNRIGYTGISWYKRYDKWRAYIKIDDKNISLGYFNLLEDAIMARKAAELKYGFHKNHGDYIPI
jgi:hypothetical protein